MQWAPLEANPEVFTSYLHALGCSDACTFVDVFGFDPDLAAFVPRPVVAFLLVYPITEAAEAAHAATDVTNLNPPLLKDLYFCPQTISNACGTMGLLHVAMNCPELIQADSWLDLQRKTAGPLSLAARSAALETDAELAAVHASFASQGQSEGVDASADVDLHFVAFVPKVDSDGKLIVVELDGRRPAPVVHSTGTVPTPGSLADSFEALADVVRREYIDNNADGDIRFNVMALTLGAD
jgi:ubiquitin carboxyl-terminal hydrolase L3